MIGFFSRNIDARGRAVRLVSGILMLIGAVASGWGGVIWLAVALGLSGAFVTFEGLRGWCLLRACGIKTRL